MPKTADARRLLRPLVVAALAVAAVLGIAANGTAAPAGPGSHVTASAADAPCGYCW